MNSGGIRGQSLKKILLYIFEMC